MNVHDLYPSKYLKAADLGGVSHVVRILRIEVQEIGNPQHPDRKPVIYFVGHEKGLVANKTNCLIAAARFGPDMLQWIGKDIELFSTIVQGPNGPVEGIRVRPIESPLQPQPMPLQPQPMPPQPQQLQQPQPNIEPLPSKAVF
jgi:hypothetical protein